jgi:hypothetical protein
VNGFDKQLVRPKDWSALKKVVPESTLSRRIREDTITHTEINVYSKKGWFTNLGSKWTTRDLILNCVIIFDSIYKSQMVRHDDTAEGLRGMANLLAKMASQIQNFSVQLHERADAKDTIQEDEVAE